MSADLSFFSLGRTDLPEGWQVLALEEVCKGIFDCPHSTPKLSNDGPLMARTQDIRDGYFKVEGAVHVSLKTYHARTKRSEPRHGDLLFSREGTYFGDAAEVPIKTLVCLGQRMVLLRPNNAIVTSSFLRIWINSRSFQKYLMGFRDGTVAERLNLTTIRKLPVIIPPINYQDFVVRQIVPFERKAANCRGINHTLEELAQAIFKSWFVDFEPVKAKIEAKENGQDPERAAMCAISGKTNDELDQLTPEQISQLTATAALFPDKLIESELGLIPQGWKIVPFTDIALLDTTSVTPQNDKEKFWEHYSIPAFDESESPTFELGVEIKSNKYRVRPTSILVSKLNPHFPRIWLPAVNDEEAAICSTEFMQFVPILSNHRAYIYQLILSSSFQQGILQRVTGTTGSRQRAQPKSVAKMLVINPGEDLVTSFVSISEDMFSRKEINIKESRTLAQIRSTLLPKLLSGEIELKQNQ